MLIRDICYIAEDCPEEFLDCAVVYHNSWSDYEENGWVVVFELGDETFIWQYQYSVMSSDNSVIFDPEVFDMNDLPKLQANWDKIVKQNDEYMSNSGGY